jgi:putative membrane protein
MDTRPLDESAIFSIERPAPNLMTYYLLSSFVLGPLFFILLIPLYFRYHTLRYRFDEEGISMRWGILFRREINLTYARIQDIHLRSNFVERWLNLARVEVQTASGSSGAEMTYTRMRGSHDQRKTATRAPTASARVDTAVMQDLAQVLREVTAELRAVREALDGRERGELP